MSLLLYIFLAVIATAAIALVRNCSDPGRWSRPTHIAFKSEIEEDECIVLSQLYPLRCSGVLAIVYHFHQPAFCRAKVSRPSSILPRRPLPFLPLCSPRFSRSSPILVCRLPIYSPFRIRIRIPLTVWQWYHTSAPLLVRVFTLMNLSCGLLSRLTLT